MASQCDMVGQDKIAKMLRNLTKEIVRLTDGIRFLINTYDPYEVPDASLPVRELRSLLDVTGEDR